jgi:hypothetical protein
MIELKFHHPAGVSLAKTCGDLTRQIIDMVSREYALRQEDQTRTQIAVSVLVATQELAAAEFLVTNLLHKSNLHTYLDVVGVEVNLNIIQIPGYAADAPLPRADSPELAIDVDLD